MEKRLKALLPGGVFVNVSAVRSGSMSRIRGKDNRTTERVLRMALVRSKLRGWTMHSNLPGRPDFYFVDRRLAVFVDGCFWHGCSRCGHVPATRSEFWNAKFKRNRQRDRQTTRRLKSQGIRVLRLWEHQLKNPDLIRDAVMNIQLRLAISTD
jgi:DNA mismatch endonuclease, patch repair protein